MSVKLYPVAWNYPAGDAFEKIVLVYFADKASADGSDIRPAIDTVAHQCSISRRSVQRAIKALLDKGAVVKTHEAVRAKPASYRLDLARMREIIAASEAARTEAKTSPEARGDG